MKTRKFEEHKNVKSLLKDLLVNEETRKANAANNASHQAGKLPVRHDTIGNA